MVYKIGMIQMVAIEDSAAGIESSISITDTINSNVPFVSLHFNSLSFQLYVYVTLQQLLCVTLPICYTSQKPVFACNYVKEQIMDDNCSWWYRHLNFMFCLYSFFCYLLFFGCSFHVALFMAMCAPEGSIHQLLLFHNYITSQKVIIQYDSTVY